MFAGPGIKLQKRLVKGQLGKNRLDHIPMHHDIAYSKAKNLQNKWNTDEEMIGSIDPYLERKP